MGQKKDFRLTPDETKAIQKIENSEDLNQIKMIEDRVVKILDNLGMDTSQYTKDSDKDTLELSDAYYKRVILKSREKMMEQKATN
mmetsp:Transcript_17989/g.15913  ORF Transcript_17989/g.15913 Transcript_17989/m.15913 type:complete len:85 (+) Transcript_17989:736-990(+)